MTQPRWAILTGEYPPDPGGVSDYTRLLAAALANRGHEVHVFAPGATGARPDDPPVQVHSLPGRYGPSALIALSRQLDRLGDVRILVQYVPHAFGCRGMNLLVCLWLYVRSRRNVVMTIFHEVSYPFRRRQPLRHQFIALVNRAMGVLVASASQKIVVTIPGWIPLLKQLGVPRHRIIESPIFSNLPLTADPVHVCERRRGLAPDGQRIFGHFGSRAPTVEQILDDVIPPLLNENPGSMLLIGRESDDYASKLRQAHPELSHRLLSVGQVEPQEAAELLSACHLLVQVYPDGASGRRGTLLAGLALGVPVVSNLGRLSEDYWARSGALVLAPSPDPAQIVQAVRRALADEHELANLAARGRALYAERFDIQHTVERLIEACQGTT